MSRDDCIESTTMPDQKELLEMIEDAKNDSLAGFSCGLDHLRLMRVVREYSDRRYRAGFNDAIKSQSNMKTRK